MNNTALKLMTIEEFLALPEHAEGERLEFIDGVPVRKAQPGGRHADVELSLASSLRQLFRKPAKSDGTGGWWIMSEVSVRFRQTERILTPDIVGWRRDRVPVKPAEYPVAARPDWVCEISHTTRKKDTTTVLQTLEAEGVPFYWIADVEAENLMVFELVNGKYTLAQSLFRDDGNCRIKPFEAAELNIGILFGDDAPAE